MLLGERLLHAATLSGQETATCASVTDCHMSRMQEEEAARRRQLLWMRRSLWSVGGAAVFGVATVAAAGAGVGPPAQPVVVSCPEAIYVAGAPVPRPVRAVTAGPVVFNSLAHPASPRN